MHKMKVSAPIIIKLLLLLSSYHCVSSFSHAFGEPSSIRVCLTPPNTLKKVQAHIKECQHEVNAHIFNEAYTLLHEHGFPHIVYDDAHEPLFNFTESDQEILNLVGQTHHGSAHNHHHHPPLHTSHHHHDVHVHPDVHDIHHHVHGDPILHHHHQPIDLPPLHPKIPYADPFDTNSHNFGNFHWENVVNKKSDSLKAQSERDRADESLKAAESKSSYTFFNLAAKLRGKRHVPVWKETIVHDTNIHPTVITFKEKRIAGCLMNCLYQRNGVIDGSGWPSLDGLVNFYSDGVHEHGFFMTVLRASDYCLKGASIKYHVSRHSLVSLDTSCDVAFDLFDCVSDKITEYCSQHHFHHSAPHHGHTDQSHSFSLFHGRK